MGGTNEGDGGGGRTNRPRRERKRMVEKGRLGVPITISRMEDVD